MTVPVVPRAGLIESATGGTICGAIALSPPPQAVMAITGMSIDNIRRMTSSGVGLIAGLDGTARSHPLDPTSHVSMVADHKRQSRVLRYAPSTIGAAETRRRCAAMRIAAPTTLAPTITPEILSANVATLAT